MTELSPAAQSFLGPSVIGLIALLLWGIQTGWFARKTWRKDRRTERKEDKTDEYEAAQLDDKVHNLEAERELRISDVWKTQFKEMDERYKQRLKELEVHEQQNYAEYTHRLLGYQSDLSNAKAEIKVLQNENVKCNETATKQAIRIGGLEDRLVLILNAIEGHGINLGLSWMNPKTTPANVTTMIVQSESNSVEGQK